MLRIVSGMWDLLTACSHALNEWRCARCCMPRVVFHTPRGAARRKFRTLRWRQWRGVSSAAAWCLVAGGVRGRWPCFTFGVARECGTGRCESRRRHAPGEMRHAARRTNHRLAGSRQPITWRPKAIHCSYVIRAAATNDPDGLRQLVSIPFRNGGGIPDCED